jgi:hypothetical protein
MTPEISSAEGISEANSKCEALKSQDRAGGLSAVSLKYLPLTNTKAEFMSCYRNVEGKHKQYLTTNILSRDTLYPGTKSER